MMWNCQFVYIFLVLLSRFVFTKDIVFSFTEGLRENIVLSVDPDDPENVKKQVDVFFETHAEDKDLLLLEKFIRLSVDRNMQGIQFKRKFGIESTCEGLLSDTDVSIMFTLAYMLLEGVLSLEGVILEGREKKKERVIGNKEEGEKFLYAETGSFLGCSSILMASILPPESLVYAHDLWVDTSHGEILSEAGLPPKMVDDYFYVFYDNIRKRGLEKRVIPVRGNSSYTVGIHQPESIDFGFIDGDHSYQGAMNDLRNMYPLIKPGGILLVHDVVQTSSYQNSVAEAVFEFCKNLANGLCDNKIGGTEMVKIYKNEH